MRLINPEVRIENSSKCNANCIMCPRDQMTRPKVIMPNDHFFNLVDQAKALKAKTVSVFGYGEPLMDKDTPGKVKYCTEQGLETFITTNAGLLNEQMSYDLLDAGLTHIRFSVHGIFPNDYEAVHKGLQYRRVIRNIMNFMYANDTKFKHACKTSVSVIPSAGENKMHIRAFWKPMVDWLEIWKPHGWAGALQYRGKTATRRKTCGRPGKGPVQINADGKMMVCCFDTDAKMTVGDTYKNTIEEILKGDEFNRIRDIHKAGQAEESDLPCKGCDQLNQGPTPLLYSSRDKDNKPSCTSSTKFKLT